jgi:GNAT superfamily N-acetyltransferase
MGLSHFTPAVPALATVVETLGSWQRDDAVVQLHPGDLGWAGRSGASDVAASTRIWSDDDVPVAIGFFDGPEVFRMTVSPARWSDDELAARVRDDLSEQGFSPGPLSVELPDGTALRAALTGGGWTPGEAWTPLARTLTGTPIDIPPGLTIDRVDEDGVEEFTAVHRSAWDNRRFTDAVWRTMAGGPAFRAAECLLAYDASGTPVAGVTIWAAGGGRPGILEPMGVHAEHRGRGHGTAICIAAAAALQRLGASIAWVCTPSSRDSAIATYRSAGFLALPERLDLVRPARRT